MTKRKGVLDIGVDVRELIGDLPSAHSVLPKEEVLHSEVVSTSPLIILTALDVITRQMRVSGYRERTISDYTHHVKHFQSVTGVKFVSDITTNHIYNRLDNMNVSNQTKLTRLKCLKAFLSRCFDNH